MFSYRFIQVFERVLISVILLGVGFVIGYYNSPTQEDIAVVRNAHGRCKDLLHIIYSESNNPQSSLYSYWEDVIMETDEYYQYDLAIDGDWEDFYYY